MIVVNAGIQRWFVDTGNTGMARAASVFTNVTCHRKDPLKAVLLFMLLPVFIYFSSFEDVSDTSPMKNL